MNKTLSAETQIALIFLALAFALGAAMRIFPILRADFPLADGGMFYAMIQDLRAADFSLPQFTSYNRAEIPFAYPPLGFYLAAALNALTGASPLQILRWLPLAVSLLNLPLYYLLARQLADSAAQAALATLLFALVPGSYWWNIVGGGLTRSLGMFFFTAAALSLLQMFRRGTQLWFAASVFSVSAVFLSHPSWALQTVLAAIPLWLFYGRNKRGISLSILLAAGVLLLTSPWWGVVVQRHGAQVFLDASRNAYSLLQALAIFLMLSFGSEQVPVIAFLGVCGFFLFLAQKKYVLPAWVALCFWVEPRGGAGASLLPFSILAAAVLSEGIAPRLAAAPPVAWTDAIRYQRGRLFFAFLMLTSSFNAFKSSEMISRRVLSAEERAALAWVRAHTAASSRFLILDEEENPVYSPLTEWFPALAERRSVATIQGTEWLPGEKNFTRVFSAAARAHDCFFQDVECLRAIRAELPDDYDYVMLSVKAGRNALLESLRLSEDFALMYSSPTVFIFRAE